MLTPQQERLLGIVKKDVLNAANPDRRIFAATTFAILTKALRPDATLEDPDVKDVATTLLAGAIDATNEEHRALAIKGYLQVYNAFSTPTQHHSPGPTPQQLSILEIMGDALHTLLTTRQGAEDSQVDRTIKDMAAIATTCGARLSFPLIEQALLQKINLHPTESWMLVHAYTALLQAFPPIT
jgi:hypothetical protein